MIVIIGAGPAGLTAAYELLKRGAKVTVLEESGNVGGLSRTEEYKGYRMDIGGHRFFSKSEEINKLWDELVPDMLTRERVSRIYFDGKFFDYPLTPNTLKTLGAKEIILCALSYLAPNRTEKSLEDFYINRFGKRLYKMFFERYTENLWGRHPRDIDPSWGSQRVKGLSIKEVLKRNSNETSLIDSFKYPKYGPGQMWQIMADKIKSMGGEIVFNARVTNVLLDKGRVSAVVCDKGFLKPDLVFSSMPIKDLIRGMNDVPESARLVSEGLPYRDYMTLGVLADRLAFDGIKDDWIYIQDKRVNLGRVQIYNNWSPYLAKDGIWLGLEYFTNEGSALWTMKNFADMAVSELEKVGLVSRKNVLDTHLIRVKKAYPAYFDTYSDMKVVKDFLLSIDNLYCIGRNGQHRYNNMDHSMLTAKEAVRSVFTGDRETAWNVNTEDEYHESIHDRVGYRNAG